MATGAVPLLVVHREKVLITDENHLNESKSFVALMGPPGAGKSTLSNTFVYCQQSKPERMLFFQPNDGYESFTKGVWMLSKETKRKLTYDSDWELLDMEGFQDSSKPCWTMAMVLSVLAEVVVFCSRDARADVLLKAAAVFAMGMKCCEQLSMPFITKQVFIQIQSDMYRNSAKVSDIIAKVKGILRTPEIEVIAFCIPEIETNCMEEVPFNPKIAEAVQDLLKKFKLDKNSQAASAKAAKLKGLLKAFNERNFDECDAQSRNFFRLDCERIWQTAVLAKRAEHNAEASKTELTSPNTTFEQFMGQPDWEVKVCFKDSPYYNEKHEQLLETWYPLEKRFIRMPDIYREYYDIKKKVLESKLEQERQLKAAHRSEFRQLQETAIKTAKERLTKYIGTLEKYRPLFENIDFRRWESFVDETELKAYIKDKPDLFVKPDWSEFESEYKTMKNELKNGWDLQIQKAKWVAPVKAQGELICENGHKLTDDVVCGKSTCNGKLYWIDGPNEIVICIECNDIWKTSTSLTCKSCKAKSKATIRPSMYIP